MGEGIGDEVKLSEEVFDRLIVDWLSSNNFTDYVAVNFISIFFFKGDRGRQVILSFFLRNVVFWQSFDKLI